MAGMAEHVHELQNQYTGMSEADAKAIINSQSNVQVRNIIPSATPAVVQKALDRCHKSVEEAVLYLSTRTSRVVRAAAATAGELRARPRGLAGHHGRSFRAVPPPASRPPPY